jgi:hypothetical protein
MLDSTSLPSLRSASHMTAPVQAHTNHNCPHPTSCCNTRLTTDWETNEDRNFKAVISEFVGLKDGDTCFRGTYCLHLQGINSTLAVKNKLVSSPTFAKTHRDMRCQNPQDYNLKLYPYGLMITLRTARCNTESLYVLPTQCICVFCVDLRTNNDYFSIQH